MKDRYHLKLKNILNPLVIFGFMLLIHIAFFSSVRAKEFDFEKLDMSQLLNLSEADVRDNIKSMNKIIFAKGMASGINKSIDANSNDGKLKKDKYTWYGYAQAQDTEVMHKFHIKFKKLLKDEKINISDKNKVISFLKINAKKTQIKTYCSVNLFRVVLEEGVIFSFFYQAFDGESLFSFSLKETDCK